VVWAKPGVGWLLLVLPADLEVAEARQDDPSKPAAAMVHWLVEVEVVFHPRCLLACFLAWVADE
jgi:hypothetical protein